MSLPRCVVWHRKNQPLAARHQLPVVYYNRFFVVGGGLTGIDHLVGDCQRPVQDWKNLNRAPIVLRQDLRDKLS